MPRTVDSLDPGDRMPGAGGDPLDEMDSLMSDWSWRDQRPDPGYVYTAEERARYMLHLNHDGGPFQMPAVRPWSFPAYRGPIVRPPRIGVTR